MMENAGKTIFMAASIVALSSAASARECTFMQMCSDLGPCSKSAYTVEIDIPNGQLITPNATHMNEGYIGGLAGETMLFRGDDQTFLLSVDRANEARLSLHKLTDGADAQLFVGTCEPR
ncbi:MAG: hypothetical protein AAF826_05400 [Pseudomonadota bacterium]